MTKGQECGNPENHKSRPRDTTMVRVYRYILACCLAMTASAATYASDYSDCTILSRSTSNVTFSYRPASFAWATNAQGVYAAIPNTALDLRDL